MNITIKSSRTVGGNIAAPPSKSMAHRAVLCAALAKGTSHLHHLAFSKDISTTLGAAGRLCARVTTGENDAVVEGLGRFLPVDAPVDCCESGSTLRFLIPLASLTGQEVTFTGRGRLMERPQSVYKTLYQQQGLRFEQGADRLTVEGALTPGEYELAGNVSSQFISGLLFALPLLGGTSTLHLIPPVESRSYIDMTRAVQHAFGVESRWLDENTLEIPGGQHYLPGDYTVEGDYSQAAFPAVLGAVTGGVAITGLSEETLQGDAAILEILRRCGARFTRTGQGLVFEKAPLHGTDIDLADCPDLGPVLMVLGLLCEGTTVIRNAERLRIKESDRIEAMETELRACGGQLESEGGTITIHGCAGALHAPEQPLSGHNDHRVVMSLAVLALAAGLALPISGAEAIAKSWPDFSGSHQAFWARRWIMLDKSKRYLIVGLGLLGGKYALELSRAGFHVDGINRSEGHLQYALDHGYIASGKTHDFEDLVRQADHIIFGLYPTALLEWFRTYGNLLKEGCIFTDVSGVKTGLVEPIQAMCRPGVEFIASHPMAGRETSSVEHAAEVNFAPANFIVTPTEKNTPEAVQWARELAEVLGFKHICTLTVQEHDRMIGYVSQLCHAIAVSLMCANDNTSLCEYTGDSFRDLTRIARINDKMWAELFLWNKENLISEIDQFSGALNEMRNALVADDREKLEEMFRLSTQRRAAFDKKAP